MERPAAVNSAAVIAPATSIMAASAEMINGLRAGTEDFQARTRPLRKITMINGDFIACAKSARLGWPSSPCGDRRAREEQHFWSSATSSTRPRSRPEWAGHRVRPRPAATRPVGNHRNKRKHGVRCRDGVMCQNRKVLCASFFPGVLLPRRSTYRGGTNATTTSRTRHLKSGE